MKKAVYILDVFCRTVFRFSSNVLAVLYLVHFPYKYPGNNRSMRDMFGPVLVVFTVLLVTNAMDTKEMKTLQNIISQKIFKVEGR